MTTPPVTRMRPRRCRGAHDKEAAHSATPGHKLWQRSRARFGRLRGEWERRAVLTLTLVATAGSRAAFGITVSSSASPCALIGATSGSTGTGMQVDGQKMEVAGGSRQADGRRRCGLWVVIKRRRLPIFGEGRATWARST